MTTADPYETPGEFEWWTVLNRDGTRNSLFTHEPCADEDCPGEVTLQYGTEAEARAAVRDVLVDMEDVYTEASFLILHHRETVESAH